MTKDEGWIDLDSGSTWDQKDPIQGVYTAKRENVGQNNANMYMIDVDGELVGVWGSTVLDSKFEQVPLKAEIRIEFLGEATSKSGGKYKNYGFRYRETKESEAEKVFPGSEEA